MFTFVELEEQTHTDVKLIEVHIQHKIHRMKTQCWYELPNNA